MYHIIDDDLIVQQTLKELIEYKGYVTRSFDSAEDYLIYFHAPDYVAPYAILSDYDMPGMNGIQLIKQIHRRYPQQNAIIISGNLSSDLAIAVQLNKCYQLSKPYHPDTLFSLLATFASYQSLRSNGDSINILMPVH